MSFWQQKIFESVKNNKMFLFLLGLIVFIARMGTWLYDFENDHLFFFIIGKELLAGRILYLDIWDHKPPLIYFINSLMGLILGDSVIVHRVFFTVWMLIELWVFYKLLQTLLAKTRTKQVDFLSRLGVLLYAFWRNLSQFAYSGDTTENFGLIFILGMYWAYLKYENHNRLKWLFLSGVFLSIQVFLKPTFIFFSLPILINLSWQIFTSVWERKWHLFVRDFVLALKCVGIFFLPTVLQTLGWSWYFYSKGVFDGFWLASVEFSRKYAETFVIDFQPELLYFVIINMLLLVISLIVAMMYFWQDKASLWANKYNRFVTWISLASLLFGINFIIFFPYYQLVIIPGLIILVVHLDFLKLKAVFQSLLIGVLIFSAGSSLLISYKSIFYYFDDQYAQTAKEQEEITEYLKTHLQGNEHFYSYSYGTTFYYLTGQLTVSKYVAGPHLLWDYKYNYGFHLNETVMQDLDKDDTKYILLHKNTLKIKSPMLDYINRCYAEDRVWNRYAIYKRREGC